ncbi:MAG TPA: hypothetical protein VIJ88_02315 [Candidatus Paceibacterota bacterium]
MKKVPDADMQKLDALETEIAAFAERYGILHKYSKRDKEEMIREARRRNEPIESLIEEVRQKTLEIIPHVQDEVPFLQRCVATLH